MPGILIALWCAQILCEALAAIHLWRTGLVNRFPILTTWFAASGSFSLVMLMVHRFSPRDYRPLYSIACMLLLLLESGCVVEAFFALCGKFRNFARIGGSLLVILWLIAAASSAAARLSWVPPAWTETWQLLMLGARYADLVMVIVLASSWAILRIPNVPIARSADRVTLIVGVHSVYGFILSSVTITRNDSPYWWLVAFTLIGGCLTGLAATFLLRAHPGEYALPPAPSKEEVAAAFRDADLAYQEFCAGADAYLRRLKEQ